MAQLQELSKHVAMQQIYRLNDCWVGGTQRGAGLVSAEASDYSDVAARQLLSPAEAGHRRHLFTLLLTAEVCCALW